MVHLRSRMNHPKYAILLVRWSFDLVTYVPPAA